MVFSYNQSWTFKISLISQIVSFDADAHVLVLRIASSQPF